MAFLHWLLQLHGVDPANVIYQQDKMREHLIKCLEEEDVTLFPQRGSRRANSKRICSIKLLVFASVGYLMMEIQ